MGLASLPCVNTPLNRLRSSTADQRLRLARSGAGLFDFSAFVNGKSGYLHPSIANTLYSLVVERNNNRSWGFGGGGGSASHQTNDGRRSHLAGQMVGWLSTLLSLDMMVVCAKAYSEQMSEFTLNAMMIKVSKDGKRQALLKDPMDIKYHLVGYPERTPAEQAVVLRYCSKDAHLVAIVSASINKEGEIFQLSEESGLSEATVVGHLTKPLCIIEGALYQTMGPDRASLRGCGIRRHSLAMDTKGGMVSQPLLEQTPLQTVDLSSLYPSIMVGYNLCTTTFVTHGQVVALRNRIVYGLMNEKSISKPTLEIMDLANARVLESYHPIDLAVTSWLAPGRPTSANTDKSLVVPTRLENELGFEWWKPDDQQLDLPPWSANQSPNVKMQAAGLDYFPEVPCCEQLQLAALANDDAHINPSGLEYLVTVLPILAWRSPRIASHVTAWTCSSPQELWSLLELDFDVETDRKLKVKLCDFRGDADGCRYGIPDPISHQFLASQEKRKIKGGGRIGTGVVDYTDSKHCDRLVQLCDRIFRRVNGVGSWRDPAVVKWARRMLDVGTYCRTWNATKAVVPGVDPDLQIHYRARRVAMKAAVKKYRETDPILADRNDVAEKVTKVFMNSKYGVLALRSSTRVEETESTMKETQSIHQKLKGNAVGGVGGGTRHMPMANQITQVARRVFGNIGTSIHQLLPNVRQVYGDTDSTFLVHNIPGDGTEWVTMALDGDCAKLIVDLHLKVKLARGQQ